MQFLLHYFLHLVFPLAIAWVFFRSDWKKVYVILLLTMLVDLDHLFAETTFQADRCSINYHPLHSYYAIVAYLVLLIRKGWIRIISIGLLFHMLTDFIDCVFMFNQCPECLINTPAYNLLNWFSDL